MIGSSQFHAYTDGTDTIIGTSLEEAVRAYSAEMVEMGGLEAVLDEFRPLEDSSKLTLLIESERGSRSREETKTIREWIDWHISQSPEKFSRVIGSTEY